MLNRCDLYNLLYYEDNKLIFKNINKINEEALKKCILNLLELYNIYPYCNKIEFNHSNDFMASYSLNNKMIILNYECIKSNLIKVNQNIEFIKLNIYRIILHEIKHIIQHKMVNNRTCDLYKIFEKEFSGNYNGNIMPSEINADYESTYLVYELSKNYIDIISSQLLFTINMYLHKYKLNNNSLKFCQNNDIVLNIEQYDLKDKLFYGLINFDKNKLYELLDINNTSNNVKKLNQ